ncbi:MAG: hypothetical protein ABIH23_01610 [bacterium]
MKQLGFVLFALVVVMVGSPQAQDANLEEVLASADEASAQEMTQVMETTNGARISMSYKAYRWSRKITDALKNNSEIRSQCNKDILWQLAEAETNASIYSEGIVVPAGKFKIGFIATAYDWYIVVTNENGQRIVEEIAPVESSSRFIPRLVMSAEPGDLANDAVLVIQYGTEEVRLPFTLGTPSK